MEPDKKTIFLASQRYSRCNRLESGKAFIIVPPPGAGASP
jgi:hypothetical protein